MQYIDWIVELWNHDRNIVGITRLTLSQVYSAIFDSISPISYIKFLKTNLYPMVVYDGDLPVETLRTKDTIGILRIRLAFGTAQ